MTPAIDRYPVELIGAICLADGRRVMLRPVLPQDLELHAQFFDGLSQESRYNRFFNPAPKLSAQMLEHLMHVDHRSRVALIAELISDGKERVIADARYAVGADGGSAELALCVADEFHGLGLGTLLLDRLVCAASRAGVGHLVGETLAANDRMLRLARRAGFTVTSDPQLLHLMRLEKRLWSVDHGAPAQDAA